MTERWIADSLPSEKFPVYTRGNAGEVMPDPVSPLSATLSVPGPGEQGWRDSLVWSGAVDRDELEADRHNTCAVFGGYFYLNLSLIRLYGVRMPGLTPEIADVQYLGDLPGVLPYAEEARPTDVSPKHEALMTQYLGQLVARQDWPELRADRDEVNRWVARRPDLSEASEQELVDIARSYTPLYRRLFCRHLLVTAASGVGIGMVSQVLAAAGRPDLLMTVLSGLGDVDSAAPSFAMWELGRLVRGSAGLTALFDAGVAGLNDRIKAAAEAGDNDAAEFEWRFGHFLRDYGCRGPNEWELRSSVWGTNPDLPLAAIERMRLADDADSPTARTDVRAGERTTATRSDALLAGDAESAGAFTAGLRVAQLANVGRERTKTNNIKIVHEMRLALRELGRRMVERGVLGSVEELFMLVDDELDAFVDDPSRFSAVVREREAHYLSLWELEPPFVSVGAPPPTSEWPERSAAVGTTATVGTVLTGIPGCPGTVQGRARVVTDPADPRGLEPGEVLVAPYTDPSWTPLFVPAAAVVVDVGAQITHAVIVSRELGLPCVVSVTGATRIIPDGALVEVDGAAGTVTVLSLS